MPDAFELPTAAPEPDSDHRSVPELAHTQIWAIVRQYLCIAELTTICAKEEQ